jgi:hypothetical protein
LNPAWSAEWRVALRRRRLLALNTFMPLLLVAPIALAGAPAGHAAAVYSVLFVLFGVFGSAIPLVRDGADGLLTRWHLAGLPARELLTGRIAAQTVLDVLQAAPSVAVIVLAGGGAAAPVFIALPFTLLVANALGAWTAALARSLAEGALFSSVTALLLLHGAGTFRTPAPGSLAERIERVSPFRVLHEAFLTAAGGASTDAGGAPTEWTPALIAGAAFLLITALLAVPLIARISRATE